MSGRCLQTPKSHVSQAWLSHVSQTFDEAATSMESLKIDQDKREWVLSPYQHKAKKWGLTEMKPILSGS